jgi:hypothetical protein
VGEGYRKILVDCNGLEYISSAGLGVFMSYIEEMKDKNIPLVLFGMKEKVANTFSILGWQIYSIYLPQNRKQRCWPMNYQYNIGCSLSNLKGIREFIRAFFERSACARN